LKESILIIAIGIGREPGHALINNLNGQIPIDSRTSCKTIMLLIQDKTLRTNIFVQYIK